MQNQENQTLALENESVNVTVTRQPGCIAVLDVVVQPSVTKEAYEAAVKAVKREVSIPGFRKGKVPENVVKTNFASAIEREFRDHVMQDAFRKSLELAKIYPFGKQAVKRSEMKKCSIDDGAVISFTLETEPAVPEIDVDALETKPTANREITEKHIERAYKHLKVMQATWQDVEEVRPAKQGDFVEVDIDVIQHPAHNICTNQLLHLETDELPRWLFDALIGMQADESKETLASPQPDDPTHIFVYEENTPPKETRVVLKKIKTAILPEENEEFFKRFGVTNIEELKKALDGRLKLEEAEYANDLSRYNLRREILQKYTFDLPQSLLDAEIRGRFAFCKSGADLAQGSLPSEQKDAELKGQIEAEARGFFAWMHLLRQFTAKIDTNVTQQDLQDEFQHQMRLPRIHRLVYPGLTPEDVRHRLFMLILMRKCEEYLLSLKQST